MSGRPPEPELRSDDSNEGATASQQRPSGGSPATQYKFCPLATIQEEVAFPTGWQGSLALPTLCALGAPISQVSGVRSAWLKRSMLIPYRFFPSNGCIIALGRIMVGNSTAVGKKLRTEPSNPKRFANRVVHCFGAVLAGEAANGAKQSQQICK